MELATSMLRIDRQEHRADRACSSATPSAVTSPEYFRIIAGMTPSEYRESGNGRIDSAAAPAHQFNERRMERVA